MRNAVAEGGTDFSRNAECGTVGENHGRRITLEKTRKEDVHNAEFRAHREKRNAETLLSIFILYCDRIKHFQYTYLRLLVPSKKLYLGGMRNDVRNAEC